VSEFVGGFAPLIGDSKVVQVKDNAIKCWHCNTMLRPSRLRWLLLIALLVSALYSWILTHQTHGHLMTLNDLGDLCPEHIPSLMGVLGSVLAAGIFRSPLGE